MNKKQKRAAGEAKQALNRAEAIRSGLQAQKRDREARERKAKAAKEKAAEEEARLQRLANQAYTASRAFEKMGDAAGRLGENVRVMVR